MNSQTTHTPTTNAADEAAISAIPLQMADAWRAVASSSFAAPFTENADFVVFEGTHLKGRREIASFSQQIFDTVVRGSHLQGEMKFVHFLSPQLAVMHAVARVTLHGQTQPSPSRDSMQIFVVAKHDGDWRAEAVLNARRLTMRNGSSSGTTLTRRPQRPNAR